MLTKVECAGITALLKREMVPAVGCTEPLAVALAVAKARELLEEMPVRIVARLSGNVIKNAMGVGIPGTRDMVGLKAAIALGAVAGKSAYGLEVLKEVPQEAVDEAKRYIAGKNIEILQARHCPDNLYIDIEMCADGHSSQVTIAREPVHYIYIKKDGEVLLDETREAEASSVGAMPNACPLTMRKVYDYATRMPIEELRFILESVRMNKAAAEMAFAGDYGLNLGKMLNGSYEARMVGHNTMPRIVTYTCAACDLRMAGARVCVMCNSGSGNQGVAATLPVVIFAEDVCASESKLVRALTLSHLTVIYINQLLGRLSAHCGCVLAAAGSACGITYLMGGSYDQITFSIKNMVASLTGMVCDGAKPSCSLKLSSGVSQAFQAAMMAMENRCVSSMEGIIDEDIDRTIENLAEIGREGMVAVDRMILQIMLDKTSHD